MNKYESYKEVELSWLKEIPSHWECRRGKYIYEIKTGKLDVNAGSENGQYPFFTCSSLPKKINHYSFDCEALLVAGNGMVGHTQYYKGKFNAYQRTYVLNNFKNINPIYAKWYFKGILVKYLEKRYVGSVINFIVLNDLKSFEVLLPPIEEQKQIANYLDWKIDEIDRLILTEKEKLKELNKILKLKIDNIFKKAIKNSTGIIRLRFLYSFQNGISTSKDYTTGQYPFLTYSDVYNNLVLPNKLGGKINSSQEERTLYSVRAGDLFVTRTSEKVEDAGKVSLALMDVDDAIFNGFTIRLRPNKYNDFYAKYILYYLNSDLVRDKILSSLNLVTRVSIKQDILKNIPVYKIDIDEQVQLVECIEQTTYDILRHKKMIENTVSELQELKQSLISEVVTGQIDVRNIVIPEYEKVNVIEDTKEMESEEDGS